MENAKKDQPVVGLDLLRFAAALMVACYHYTYLILVPGTLPNRILGPTTIFGDVSHWARFGLIGVELFFIISGFVISMSASGSSAKKFIEGRFLRLAPAAWICASVTLLVLLYLRLYAVSPLLKMYLSSLLFYPFQAQIDPSYWTLGIEVSFYLLVCVVLLLRKFQYFFIIMYALAFLSFTANALEFICPRYFLLTDRQAQILLLTHGCEFAIGAILYKIYTRRGALLDIVMLAVANVAATLELFHHMSIAVPDFSFIHDGPYCVALWVFCAGLIFLALFLNPILMSAKRGPMIGRIARNVGILTYPFYLLHQIVGCALQALFVGLLGNRIISALLALMLVVILSKIVLWGERVIRSLLRPHLAAILDKLLPVAGGGASLGS